MSIVAEIAYRVECDLCGAEVPGDGGTPWYVSHEAALDDLSAWEWHWLGTRHICCPECHDPCLDCDGVHGSHSIDCGLLEDTVDDWVDALVEGGA